LQNDICEPGSQFLILIIIGDRLRNPCNIIFGFPRCLLRPKRTVIMGALSSKFGARATGHPDTWMVKAGRQIETYRLGDRQQLPTDNCGQRFFVPPPLRPAVKIVIICCYCQPGPHNRATYFYQRYTKTMIATTSPTQIIP